MKKILLICWAVALTHSAFAGKAEHVVMVVWDGLRPDSINETDTPALARLAREGVFFRNHHAAYLSITGANGPVLVTGAHPSHNGILADSEYRPAIDPLRPIDPQSLLAVRKGDELSGGRYLDRPTLPEILQGAGQKTAVAGAKAVALLLDRLDQGRSCVNYFAGRTIPADAVAQAKGDAFPKTAVPNVQRDEMTTLSLIKNLWDGDLPKLSLLWLSEPDHSQHNAGIGSAAARAALQSCDRNLARVLSALDARGARSKTDVFVVSDHGFSTVSRSVDVAGVLKKNGFNAARRFSEPPAAGDVVVAGNGGSVLLYVIGHDQGLTRKLVEFLQQQDFVGVIFAREPVAGTFTLKQARIDAVDAPDVVISMRWAAENSAAGVPGMFVCDGSTRPGRGQHASLSRYDMHNTLIAVGPDFRRSVTNALPSGNIDLAPTILAILSVEPPQPMDGRVLKEAFAGRDVVKTPFTSVARQSVSPGDKTPVEINTLETTRSFSGSVWHQWLRVITYGATVYFDEGNGYSQTLRSEGIPVAP